MGKKKFFDKKKSATFQLLARDSSDPNYDGTAATDRVFVRVDNHSYSLPAFDDGPADASGSACYDEDPNSIFADAPEDYDDEDNGGFGPSLRLREEVGGTAPLPENVRREILELGFPDDGYNYLLHLREIKNTGGGSAFYQNPKAKLNQVPRDEKAYDASRVIVSKGNIDADGNIYKVASKTVGVRVQNVVDPEIAALLDDDDLSRFGSDVEDLEEDFVVQANLCEEGEDDTTDNKFTVVEDVERTAGSHLVDNKSFGDNIFEDADMDHLEEVSENSDVDKPRTRRLLDDQFDTLLNRDYASSDNEGTDCDEPCIAEEDESLAQKLNHALGNHSKDEFELEQGYKAPADILNGKEGLEDLELLQSASDVIHRCMEYAEKYQNEDDDIEDEFIFEESSDESEVWDCETIVSTCSNLNNHPGKIMAPEMTRRKKLAETVSGALNSNNPVITLRGKEKLPVDFLPHGRKVDKVIDIGKLRTEPQKRKSHSQESKEEKKERKAAIKEARREARRTKKEMKGLYKGEAHRAQKVVAFSGPASIHLM
ncbi:protein LTV1 homolog [Benincasa hispida]|uniref:protein LTV1 homolog n=1 Tax=Benincasa hispida TaxID=102211 RepID=UPI00190089E8|nr:protein LTV1 homolog [Benincasa hispida]